MSAFLDNQNSIRRICKTSGTGGGGKLNKTLAVDLLPGYFFSSSARSFAHRLPDVPRASILDLNAEDPQNRGKNLAGE